MATLTFPKGSEEQITPHFKAKEFDCPCPHCTETHVEEDALKLLETLRVYLGEPVMIHSGCRCIAHQGELKSRGYETAVGPSQHQLGNAFDISVESKTGAELAVAAEQAGFLAIGIAKDWIHADGRNDGNRKRRWFYQKR